MGEQNEENSFLLEGGIETAEQMTIPPNVKYAFVVYL